MGTSLYILEQLFMKISKFQTVLKSDINFLKYARFNNDRGKKRRTLIFWGFLHIKLKNYKWYHSEIKSVHYQESLL